MNIEQLRIKQSSFEGNRQDLQKDFKKLEKLRSEFVKKFNYDKIKDLSIEKYVVGHGEKDTFCYWLETKLMELGKIKGGTTADKKFGVYFSKEEDEYKTIPKWGINGFIAYEEIKRRIIELLDAGRNNDLQTIKKSPISPMFKGKILSTYYPDKYLNIFSGEHLDHFIAELGIEDPKLKEEVDKRQHLMNYKNKDSIMKDWSIYEFYRFLYTIIGRPVDKSKLNVKGIEKENIPYELKEYLDEDYEKIRNVKPSFLDFDIQESNILDENNLKDISGRKKIDFEKENKKNIKLGERGELVVIIAEKNYLKRCGREDLAKKIERVSQYDDSLGYDVLSFEEDGTEKYIEVKSTKSRIGTANFLISENQIRKSKSKENFYVYVVFEANQKNPKIWPIKNPFNQPESKVKITPVSYRVVINPKEKV
ncbi:MAG TPA: DUF3883 domain-containing protein [Candidatus Paceibacterota bacterium]|nr:DUF3883 domain-containing protein [Candidatus Paceibacterota bacterium]